MGAGREHPKVAAVRAVVHERLVDFMSCGPCPWVHWSLKVILCRRA